MKRLEVARAISRFSPIETIAHRAGYTAAPLCQPPTLADKQRRADKQKRRANRISHGVDLKSRSRQLKMPRTERRITYSGRAVNRIRARAEDLELHGLAAQGPLELANRGRRSLWRPPPWSRRLRSTTGRSLRLRCGPSLSDYPRKADGRRVFSEVRSEGV